MAVLKGKDLEIARLLSQLKHAEARADIAEHDLKLAQGNFTQVAKSKIEFLESEGFEEIPARVFRNDKGEYCMIGERADVRWFKRSED